MKTLTHAERQDLKISEHKGARAATLSNASRQGPGHVQRLEDLTRRVDAIEAEMPNSFPENLDSMSKDELVTHVQVLTSQIQGFELKLTANFANMNSRLTALEPYQSIGKMQTSAQGNNLGSIDD